MRRRTVLRSLGTLAPLALAGCVGSRTAPGGDDETTTATTASTTRTTTDETTAGSTTSATTRTTTARTTTARTTTTRDLPDDPPLAPGVTARSIDSESDCASATDDSGGSDTRIEGDRAVVTGSFRTSVPCFVARVVDTSYDGDTYRITVAVVRETGPEGQPTVCIQCLGRVDYTATITFEDPPAEVEVIHQKANSDSRSS